MKSRETLNRLKKFQVDEKRRRVAQIEGMIADFQRMSVDLEREIQTEQERAGMNDPAVRLSDLRQGRDPAPRKPDRSATSCVSSLKTPRACWARRSKNSES